MLLKNVFSLILLFCIISLCFGNGNDLLFSEKGNGIGTSTDVFHPNNILLNKDSTYSGKSEVKINRKREFTFKGYILPAHIQDCIISNMSELEKGKYMVDYEITEKDNVIVKKIITPAVYKQNKESNTLWVTIPLVIVTSFIAGYSSAR